MDREWTLTAANELAVQSALMVSAFRYGQFNPDTLGQPPSPVTTNADSHHDESRFVWPPREPQSLLG